MENYEIQGEKIEVLNPLEQKEEQLPIANLEINQNISESTHENWDNKLEECIKFSRSEINQENEHDFVLKFAVNCNFLGIPDNVSSVYALLKFKLSNDEINALFENAYLENQTDFAKFSDTESLIEWKNLLKKFRINEIFSKETEPFIPNTVFDNLPELLRKSTNIFEDKRERDVYFTGALCILSGCLPSTSGVYYDNKIFPNLYGLIIAPPASGKGVLKYSRALANKYHEVVYNESKQSKANYEQQISQYNKSKKDLNFTLKPQKPPFKVVFIPGNTSFSMIVKLLESNNGNGIICETEVDMLTNANRQEWGNFSPLLRAGFQHEHFSLSRRVDEEYLQISEPKISIALTGTPSQLPNLIGSIEDGLFSRFIFYNYRVNRVWNDPLKFSSINLDNYFNQLSEEVYEIVNYLRKYPTTIFLSSKQREIFSLKFESYHSDIPNMYGEESINLVRRLGLITFRICMILTALKKVENGDLSESICCSDEDFSTALSLAEVYLQHSIATFETIPKKQNLLDNSNFEALFNELPAEFTRKDAVSLCSKHKIGPRSVDSFLCKQEGKLLSKIRYGVYKKL